jgi:4-amino-4-deoxy-L-arabinose transferase-like glycosyltransferase
VILLVAVAACLLPFIGKAVHLDDPVFLWVAEQVQSNPADFFGFEINWTVSPVPVHSVNRNPPLVSYYLAAVAALGGWSEPVLHLGGLLCALFTAAGIHQLARRLCATPLAAAAMALATPVFAVSATTLMSDVLMLGWWCWALVLWIRGLDRARHGFLAAAGFLSALCALTKYFGVALLPLLLVYTVLRERRIGPRLLWLLLPVSILAVYESYTRSLYGTGLLIEGVLYAAAARQRQGVPSIERLVSGLSFTGGCLAMVVLFAPRLWRPAALITAALGVLVAPLLLSALGQIGHMPLREEDGLRWGIVLQLAVFAVGGVGVLALALAEGLREPGKPEATLLALWVLGTFVFASLLNWTVSGRAILPMAPAVGILVARRLEAPSGSRLASTPGLWGPLAAGLALSLAVAWADFQWAASARHAARSLAAEFSGGDGRLFFQGHWGFQYYMEPLGGRIYDRYDDRLEPGDWMIAPRNNTNLIRLPAARAERLESRLFASSRWITLLSMERGAGFYSSIYGPLPFAFGPAPEETYRVDRVVAPINPLRRR